MRRKKLLFNTGTALLAQLVTLISGFILPRLIIGHYGSEVNGLVSSITQFLAFFSMMEMGVGAVVRAALYKPLAENNYENVSKILISSKKYFQKIGLLLCGYSVILMVYFPLAVDHGIGYISTAILVVAIAFQSIANYMMGITYRQLLNADQLAYIEYGISIFTTILNTIASVVLIKIGVSIEIVKLVAACVFILNPLLLKIYVNRHYDLNFKLKLTEEPIKQKWNGLAQHISTYILKHTDTLILTWFSTLENVSIYYVYHLVTNGLQQLIETVTVGVSSLLGDMYARKEEKTLQDTFSVYELIIHCLVTFLYSVAAVLILPFVAVYTKGIRDANYIVPVFSILIVVANAAYCLRMPYNAMIHAAGHFRETQTSAILEACINVIISVLLVRRFGLVGVALGTLIAMLYRTIYLAWYLRSHILKRQFSIYVKHMLVDILVVLCIWFSTRWIALGSESWISWIWMAIKVTVIAFMESVLLNTVFYRKMVKNSIDLMFKKQRSKI